MVINCVIFHKWGDVSRITHSSWYQQIQLRFTRVQIERPAMSSTDTQGPWLVRTWRCFSLLLLWCKYLKWQAHFGFLMMMMMMMMMLTMMMMIMLTMMMMDTTILQKDAVLRGWMTKTEQKHHIVKDAGANLASRKPIVDLPINIPLDLFWQRTCSIYVTYMIMNMQCIYV